MAEKTDTLVSPDGKREWKTTSAVERTNLLARGWKPKDAAKPSPAAKK